MRQLERVYFMTETAAERQEQRWEFMKVAMGKADLAIVNGDIVNGVDTAL